MTKNILIGDISGAGNELVGCELYWWQSWKIESLKSSGQNCFSCKNLKEKFSRFGQLQGAPTPVRINQRRWILLFIRRPGRAGRAASVVAHHRVSRAALHAQMLEAALVAHGTSHGRVEVVTALWPLDRLRCCGDRLPLGRWDPFVLVRSRSIDLGRLGCALFELVTKALDLARFFLDGEPGLSLSSTASG